MDYKSNTMEIIVGSTVRHLNEDISGKVTAISNGVITIEDSDGFPRNYPQKDLILIDKSLDSALMWDKRQTPPDSESTKRSSADKKKTKEKEPQHLTPTQSGNNSSTQKPKTPEEKEAIKRAKKEHKAQKEQKANERTDGSTNEPNLSNESNTNTTAEEVAAAEVGIVSAVTTSTDDNESLVTSNEVEDITEIDEKAAILIKLKSLYTEYSEAKHYLEVIGNYYKPTNQQLKELSEKKERVINEYKRICVLITEEDLIDLGIDIKSLLERTVYRIRWEDLSFRDGYVILGQYGRMDYKDSRASFDYIKQLFSSRIKTDVEIEKRFDGSFVVNNIGLFKSVITLMTVKDDLNNIYNKYVSYKSLSSLSGRLSSVEPQYWHLLFEMKDPAYINYLCKKQSSNYKVVPVREAVVHQDRLASQDDGFLFTIEQFGNLWIVWESVDVSKATYVFKTYDKSYNHDMQMIYNYIVSSQNNKRLTLQDQNTIRSMYKVAGSPWHTTFGEWQTRMNHIIKRRF